MKVVVAIDSLKNSLTSVEAGRAIEAGVRKAYGGHPVQVIVKPLADGGEGTVEALVDGLDGELRYVGVQGPLGEAVSCPYGYLPGMEAAVIEMAGAAGLGLVPSEQRNPLHTTTYGVGQVMAQAIEAGIRHFIIGLGGSSTSDCGVGMLQALGYIFRYAQGKPIGLGGQEVGRIASVDDSQVLPALKDCTFDVACDVTNPLFGNWGAAYIFGPQKGASPQDVKVLDDASRSFAAVTRTYTGHDFSQTAGAGAAGGMGFAFLAYLHGRLRSGIQIVLDSIRLAEAVQDADYVITGEGRLDAHGQGSYRRSQAG
nr:glycerate kinase [Megasphaera elsdenii]